MELEKYATVLHGRAWQKYGWKVEEQNKKKFSGFAFAVFVFHAGRF